MNIKLFRKNGKVITVDNVKEVWVEGKIELYDQFHNGIDGTDWDDISIEEREEE